MENRKRAIYQNAQFHSAQGIATDEYSFVIKCLLPVNCPCGEKLLRLAGEVARRAGGVSHPRVIPQGKQNGHYGRRKGNKTAIMAAARETKGPLWPPQGEQKGRYAPVGVRPPPPLRGLSPCEAGQFIPAGFDCRHSEVVKAGILYHSIPAIRFSRWR